MGGSKSKNKNLKMTTARKVDTLSPPRITHQRQSVAENYSVIWLNERTDSTNEDSTATLTQLKNVVSNVYTCVEYEKCIDLITEQKHQRVFLILSTPLEEITVQSIHDMPQIHSIHIYGDAIRSYESWKKKFSKVMVVDTKITSIDKALTQALEQPIQNDISISFLRSYEDDSQPNLDELDPIFMYTGLLKEILFNMQYSEQAKRNFIEFLRGEDNMDPITLKNIDEFEKGYSPQNAICWYTRLPCIYGLLNSSLRQFEPGKIIKIGFFLSDLHRQIERLHKQKLSAGCEKMFYVYRGQGLSFDHFDNLQKNKGGLIAFNNFLSTSRYQDVAQIYAESNSQRPGFRGIVFCMCIDPSIPTTPFATVGEKTNYKDEDEILFSMQTVFRIGNIRKHHSSSELYEVDLTLTLDEDYQLRKLKEFIRKQTDDTTDLGRLGKLLIIIDQDKEAEQLYTSLLKQESDNSIISSIYYHLGIVKYKQGSYQEAVSFLEKSLEITPRHILLEDPSSWIPIYFELGHVYKTMGNYLKALEYYEIPYKVFEMALPSRQANFASLCNSIGTVYHDMGNYPKALEFYEKARKGYEIALPPNHPDLASSYNNIGEVYRDLGDYSKALDSHKVALDKKKKSLTPNHTDLAVSYNNIGIVYEKMKDYTNAIRSHREALKIFETNLHSNHPSFGNTYHNIAEVYRQTGDYSKALEYFEKGLEICEKNLPSNHLSLARSYNCIGQVYDDMGNNLKSLEFHQKGQKILENSPYQNHDILANIYHSIGHLYCKMNNHLKALEYFQKALDILLTVLPLNHSLLANSYGSFSSVYYKMGDYSKALEYCEKTLEIEENISPRNRSSLGHIYKFMGTIYSHMNNDRKEAEFYRKATDIIGVSLPVTIRDTNGSYKSVGITISCIGDNSILSNLHEHLQDTVQNLYDESRKSVNSKN